MRSQDVVNPISTENLQRIADQDADTVLENDGFLRMLAVEEDNVATANMLHNVRSFYGLRLLPPDSFFRPLLLGQTTNVRRTS